MTDWPHAPVHRFQDANTYIVTAGTYQKQHFFQGPERLSLLHDNLLSLAAQYRWQLHAWAVFSNHYHFMGISHADPVSLRSLMRHLHSTTAILVNRLDGVHGRRVWFQYWDTRITYQKSYLARLNYVIQNPVRHRAASAAEDYPWCSAAWFERTADPTVYKTVKSFKTDRVNVYDDFNLECDGSPSPFQREQAPALQGSDHADERRWFNR